LELWDYPTVVKKMMDLGTIKRKLDRNQYETAAQCAADVRLVWKNCMLYNAEKSDFWLLAKTLSRRFEDRYRKVKNEFYVGEEPAEDEDEEEEEEEEESEDEEEEFDDAMDDAGKSSGLSAQQMTLDAKARLASNLLILTGPELGHVITTIQLSKCPAALEVSRGVRDKMEIVVDEMDPQLFEQISRYAAEKASTRKRAVNVPIDDVSNKRKRKK